MSCKNNAQSNITSVCVIMSEDDPLNKHVEGVFVNMDVATEWLERNMYILTENSKYSHVRVFEGFIGVSPECVVQDADGRYYVIENHDNKRYLRKVRVEIHSYTVISDVNVRY